jgi:hypothetical protein
MEIIRVHTGEDGVVYARTIEVAPPLAPGMEWMYIVGEQVPVPEGLSQQEAAEHFRGLGWKVEQDMGDHQWEDESAPATHVWGDEEERTCSLCGRQFVGMGNNPEPLRDFEERCCDACNMTKVIPARLGMLPQRSGGVYGIGKPSSN